MTDHQQPEDDLFFDDEAPADIVPLSKQPPDAEARQRLREVEGHTVHLWAPTYAMDCDGEPLSVGWRCEGSGMLHLPRELRNGETTRSRNDTPHIHHSGHQHEVTDPRSTSPREGRQTRRPTE